MKKVKIETIYFVSSMNYQYVRFASTIEDAKIYATRMAKEFGGAEIQFMNYLPHTVETVYHVSIKSEFEKPRKEKKENEPETED